MNKLLERNLQQSIQSLNQHQLFNVLQQYEQLTSNLTQKMFTKNGMHYKCCIETRGFSSLGFGRNQQQALHNASKNLFSTLITNNIDIQALKQCLKFKNIEAKSNKKTSKNEKEETSFLLDQMSMIQPRQPINAQKQQAQPNCDCVFYENYQYQQSKIKHLQARINLLTQQNCMLKKLLIQGGCNEDINTSKKKLFNKENNSMHANI